MNSQWRLWTCGTFRKTSMHCLTVVWKRCRDGALPICWPLLSCIIPTLFAHFYGMPSLHLFASLVVSSATIYSTRHLFYRVSITNRVSNSRNIPLLKLLANFRCITGHFQVHKQYLHFLCCSLCLFRLQLDLLTTSWVKHTNIIGFSDWFLHMCVRVELY